MRPPPHPAEFIKTHKGARALDEWLLWQELYDRQALRPTGWLYADDYAPDYLAGLVDEDGEPTDDYPGERDISEDMCLACGCFREGHDVPYWSSREGRWKTITEYPDPCLGILPGVHYACCGHGSTGGYVQGIFGSLEGPAAARKMRALGGNPPAQAFYLDPIGRTA